MIKKEDIFLNVVCIKNVQQQGIFYDYSLTVGKTVYKHTKLNPIVNGIKINKK